ncbi:hypothetical protein [Actinomadura hibisca]|uniref:hypothetical protein n=1 Tax=Actinomadura hibisca TaxID=68565 RepID=UPI000834AAEC|nr:hypothetical protein [Actinomadura hibisca]
MTPELVEAVKSVLLDDGWLVLAGGATSGELIGDLGKRVDQEHPRWRPESSRQLNYRPVGTLNQVTLSPKGQLQDRSQHLPAWTPPWCGPARAPQALKKGALPPGAGAVLGRADQQTPLGGRRSRAAAGAGDDRRQRR